MPLSLTECRKRRNSMCGVAEILVFAACGFESQPRLCVVSAGSELYVYRLSIGI